MKVQSITPQYQQPQYRQNSNKQTSFKANGVIIKGFKKAVKKGWFLVEDANHVLFLIEDGFKTGEIKKLGGELKDTSKIVFSIKEKGPLSFLTVSVKKGFFKSYPPAESKNTGLEFTSDNLLDLIKKAYQNVFRGNAFKEKTAKMSKIEGVRFEG